MEEYLKSKYSYKSACIFIFATVFQLVKLAKKLKKEKVNADIINFGEEVISCVLIVACHLNWKTVNTCIIYRVSNL